MLKAPSSSVGAAAVGTDSGAENLNACSAFQRCQRALTYALLELQACKESKSLKDNRAAEAHCGAPLLAPDGIVVNAGLSLVSSSETRP